MTKIIYHTEYINMTKDLIKTLTALGKEGYLLCTMSEPVKGMVFCVFAQTVQVIMADKEVKIINPKYNQ